MKRIRYTKYVPDPAGEMSMEDLLSALSDYLLQSGFQNYMFYDLPPGEQTLDDLRQAIEQALLDGNLLDEEMRQHLQQMQMDGSLDELIEQLIERMEQENYISIDQPHDPAKQSSVGGQVGEAQQQAKFEITDKSLDFLGYKTLRDLMGSLGKSSFGRHDTRDLATGTREGGAVLHEYARRPAAGAAHSPAPAQGHEADRHDHRRKAFCADARRRPHLQECLRPRPAGGESNARRSFEMQARRGNDQYLHASVRLWSGAVRTKSHRDVPRQGLLHYAVHARAVPAHGLHVEEDEDYSLTRRSLKCQHRALTHLYQRDRIASTHEQSSLPLQHHFAT